MLAYKSRCFMRPLAALSVVVGVSCAAGAALAQTPPPAGDVAEPPAGEPAEPSPRINLTGEASPTIDLSTAPPPPRVGREYHRHEGLYVRVSGGLGALLGANVDNGVTEFSADGATLDFEALVGGGPAPGFSLGGGLLGSLQLSGDWEADSVVGTSNADLTTFIIGPFADGFPDPNGGWHLGGLLGLATASFDSPGGGDGETAIGFGGAGWLGYDVWVAPDWSVGGELRFDALRATDDDVTISKVGGTLSLSVLYN
jgi:hypothetical protein